MVRRRRAAPGRLEHEGDRLGQHACQAHVTVGERMVRVALEDQHAQAAAVAHHRLRGHDRELLLADAAHRLEARVGVCRAHRDRTQALRHPADQTVADAQAEVADHVAGQPDVALHHQEIIVAALAHVDADHVAAEQARHLLARSGEHVAQRRAQPTRIEAGEESRAGWNGRMDTKRNRHAPGRGGSHEMKGGRRRFRLRFRAGSIDAVSRSPPCG
jgi:hypothetical protein